MTEDGPSPDASKGGSPEGGTLEGLSQGRLWLFRAMALALVPLALWLGEAALRWTGVGYDSAFLVPGPDADTWVSNHRYGWRFFSPQLAREPVPFELPPKEAATRRIFLLGGSAAQGIPEPGFSVGAQLQSMLEGRYPEQSFEVINAAMTAINSHVVRQIADQCASRQPDLFIIYMGNNEVVGPYGLASVFGRYSASLPLLRLDMALRASRWGQWIQRWGAGTSSADRWQGMEMFLQQQVTADDPRLEGVYRHYERNLVDIITRARRVGAEVVVSTVASNLGQPPFASSHGRELTAAELAAWTEHFEAGLGALEAGHAADAEQRLAAALAIDDGHALLHFHHGRALRALGRAAAARRARVAARDLDTLRFRADSRLNHVVRRVASQHGVPLFDAAGAIDGLEGWSDGVPAWSPVEGQAVPEVSDSEAVSATVKASGAAATEPPMEPPFYEHVHLTFAGNHALAKGLLPAVEGALRLSSPATAPGAVVEAGSDVTAQDVTAQDVTARDVTARDLAYTPLDALVMERAILGLVEGPPFVDLWRHEADLERRRRVIWQLRQGLDGDLWSTVERLYERRLAGHPDDLLTARRWAQHLDGRGEHGRAAEVWRRLSRRYPAAGAWHAALASSLSADGRLDEALEAMQEVYRLSPQRRAEIQINEAEILIRHGELEAAEGLLRQAAAQRPEDPLPAYNLAQLALHRQDLAAAGTAFRQLTQRFPDFALGHYNLGIAQTRQGNPEAAVTSFELALQLAPYHAPSHNGHGLALEALGRHDAARQAYDRALQLDPGYILAAFNLADLLLAQGSSADLDLAVELYRRGLARQPDNRAAQRQLDLALLRLNSAAGR